MRQQLRTYGDAMRIREPIKELQCIGRLRWRRLVEVEREDLGDSLSQQLPMDRGALLAQEDAKRHGRVLVACSRDDSQRSRGTYGRRIDGRRVRVVGCVLGVPATSGAEQSAHSVLPSRSMMAGSVALFCRPCTGARECLSFLRVVPSMWRCLRLSVCAVELPCELLGRLAAALAASLERGVPANAGRTACGASGATGSNMGGGKAASPAGATEALHGRTQCAAGLGGDVCTIDLAELGDAASELLSTAARVDAAPAGFELERDTPPDAAAPGAKCGADAANGAIEGETALDEGAGTDCEGVAEGASEAVDVVVVLEMALALEVALVLAVPVSMLADNMRDETSVSTEIHSAISASDSARRRHVSSRVMISNEKGFLAWSFCLVDARNSAMARLCASLGER